MALTDAGECADTLGESYHYLAAAAAPLGTFESTTPYQPSSRVQASRDPEHQIPATQLGSPQVHIICISGSLTLSSAICQQLFHRRYNNWIQVLLSGTSIKLDPTGFGGALTCSVFRWSLVWLHLFPPDQVHSSRVTFILLIKGIAGRSPSQPYSLVL